MSEKGRVQTFFLWCLEQGSSLLITSIVRLTDIIYRRHLDVSRVLGVSETIIFIFKSSFFLRLRRKKEDLIFFVSFYSRVRTGISNVSFFRC